MKNKKFIVIAAFFLMFSWGINGTTAFGEVNNTAEENTSTTTVQSTKNTSTESSSITQPLSSTSETQTTPSIENTTENDEADKNTLENSKNSVEDDTESDSSKSTNTADTIDPTDISLFEEKILGKYPLGIATHFTAFATGNLTFGNSGVTFDGTFGGKSIGSAAYEGQFFRDTNPDSDMYPIQYVTPSENGDIKRNVTLLGANILNEQKDNTVRAISSPNNFTANGNNYYYVIEDNAGAGDKNRLLESTENSSTTAESAPVKLSEIKDFKENFGTQTGEQYFDLAKEQLDTVSKHYSSLTSKTAVVWNQGISKAEVVPVPASEPNYNSLAINIELNPSADTNGTVVINLDMNKYKDYYYHMKINITGPGDSSEYMGDSAKEKLPFIIFNWENWTTFDWPYGPSADMTYTINGESTDKMSSTFYQKMGNHILHNFPDITTEAVITGSHVDSHPFVGTIFVPHGDIKFPSSGVGTNSFWGGLISGGNIFLDTTITKGKAFGSLFDSDNLPDTMERLPGIHFTDKTPMFDLNSPISIPVELDGPGIRYTVQYELRDLTKKTAPVIWEQTIKAASDGTAASEAAVTDNVSTPLGVGKYELKATIKDWYTPTNHYQPAETDTPIFDTTEFEISGNLMLTAVPNLSFRSVSQKELALKETNFLELPLVEKAVEPILSTDGQDGNNQEKLMIEDERYQKGTYSLTVQLSSFTEINSKNVIDASIPLVLSLSFGDENDSKKVLTTNYEKDSILFDGETVTKTATLINQSEGGDKSALIEPTGSDLYIGGTSIDLGTYHAAVTWTLADAPG